MTPILWLLACGSREPLVEVPDFGSNPGNLRMYEHVPDAEGPLPLILVLHGCSQTADFAETSGFLDLADERGALLVAAEQRTLNNPQRCFDWFLPDDIAREGGEAESIAQMVASASERHNVGDVFVAGVSAGGAMAVVLLATWPELFAAGASAAGGPYGCASNAVEAAGCMTGAPDRSGEEWADAVRAVSEGPWPPLFVLHGEDDVVVAPSNADALVAQWTALGAGVQERRIEGVGHAWPVDAEAGCGEAGAFLVDADWCGARSVLDFFGL